MLLGVVVSADGHAFQAGGTGGHLGIADAEQHRVRLMPAGTHPVRVDSLLHQPIHQAIAGPFAHPA